MGDDPRLASARLHADPERLRAQVALTWRREFETLTRLGLRDGMRLLDAGTGPGFVAEALLDALPSAELTAVELDPAMATFARQQLAPFAERAHVETSSILFTEFADASFDFALARLVFQHLAAPELAASELLRVLKPGGRVAVIDVDDDLGGIMAPRPPEFELAERKMREAQASAAGDRTIGRRLWRILTEAGFEQVDLEAIIIHTDELGLDVFAKQYAPQRYAPFLTSKEREDYRVAFERFVADPEAFMLQVLLVAVGIKPRHAADATAQTPALHR